MNEQEAPPRHEEKVTSKNKLRKREQKLKERLQKAQRSQADALEHLRRAEARLRKRMARVQHLEDRLGIVHRQLEASHVSPSTVVTMIAPPSGPFPRMIEVPFDDALKQAREARAVVEVTEEAARMAVERAAGMEESLEQVESVRNQVQQGEDLQVKAEQATALASEVEEIEEEEDVLETVTAMIIADAAAIAAAQAEALAESSSTRTREANARVLSAEQGLEDIQAAILKRKLSGENAEIALRTAEREVTRAHAELADAEAAEERALNVAMNAEAEAKVTEGIAFATRSRDESSLLRATTILKTEQSDDIDLKVDDDDDDEDTLEMPVIRPKKA